MSSGAVTPDEVGQMSCQAFLQTEEGVQGVLDGVADLWTVKVGVAGGGKKDNRGAVCPVRGGSGRHG